MPPQRRQRVAKLPDYVHVWVGRRVAVPAAGGPREGYVTSARKATDVKPPVVYVHVAIIDGPLWIGPASECHVLSPRVTKHEELDDE